MELLKTLCEIFAPSGDEINMKHFLLEYIEKNKMHWKTQPVIHIGEEFQDCIILSFGKPRAAVFAHMDSIGFTVRYKNEIVKIGGPRTETGYKLIGEDSLGKVEVVLNVNPSNDLIIKTDREIDRGTSLTFKPDFRETEDFVQCCYMDNRLGIYNVLKLAESLEDGIIAFSCWEETGGGSVEYLARFIHDQYKVRQALISDITWITDGVDHGKGVVVSIRDSGIPRRSFVNKIIGLAKESGIPFQLEVESSGGSDGNVLQRSPYPFDWCFVGAPEDHVHSPDEKVHKKDIQYMIDMYKFLMKNL